MSVCGLFCTNQSEVPLAIGYLAHLIKIISSALNSKTQSTISTVIQLTKTIFLLDYKGLLVLIPIYLEQIKTVLDIDNTFSLKAKSAAISILSSLICFPDHYDNYEIPILGKVEKINMQAIKEAIVNQIENVLVTYPSEKNVEKTYHRIISKAICCANLLVYQEAAKANCNKELLKVKIKIIPLEICSSYYCKMLR